MSGDAPLYCAACEQPVDWRVACDWGVTVRCPQCGASDALDKAFADADACLQAHAWRGSSSAPAAAPRFRFVPACLARRRHYFASQGEMNRDS